MLLSVNTPVLVSLCVRPLFKCLNGFQIKIEFMTKEYPPSPGTGYLVTKNSGEPILYHGSTSTLLVVPKVAESP